MRARPHAGQGSISISIATMIWLIGTPSYSYTYSHCSPHHRVRVRVRAPLRCVRVRFWAKQEVVRKGNRFPNLLSPFPSGETRAEARWPFQRILCALCDLCGRLPHPDPKTFSDGLQLDVVRKGAILQASPPDNGGRSVRSLSEPASKSKSKSKSGSGSKRFLSHPFIHHFLPGDTVVDNPGSKHQPAKEHQ